MTKHDTLAGALSARNDEVENYQLNIDNYRLALDKIALEHAGESEMDVAMRAFAGQLRDLLQSSLIEQRKAIIIRDVIAAQLADLEP